ATGLVFSVIIRRFFSTLIFFSVALPSARSARCPYTTLVRSGGSASGTTVSSGGSLVLYGGAIISGYTLSSGAFLDIGSGYNLSGFADSGGITLQGSNGATRTRPAMLSGGTLNVSSRGIISNT